MASSRHGRAATRRPLRGVRVAIAGAGLAGLTAARALAARGAEIHLIEPRGRAGGRVWTIRAPSLSPGIAEAGGELIDADQETLRALVDELGLPLVRVLRQGFGMVASHNGRHRVYRSQQQPWQALQRALAAEIEAFRAADGDWHSSAALALAQTSLADCLARRRVPRAVCDLAAALRGFYLADPERLSTLVAVEQLIAGGTPGRKPMFRIAGGNDRLVDALAEPLRSRIDFHHAVHAVTQTNAQVHIAVETAAGRRQQLRADYLIATAPVAIVREWTFDPPLRDTQRRAFDALAYGPATKALLRFERPWWRRSDRPRAFGSTLPIGAVWEAAEDQRGAAILTLLAGGEASQQLRHLLDTGDATALTTQLRWLGRPPAEPPAVWSVTWDSDPWARGGYAVFGPAFDPAWRDELARAHGRIVFAGEHTSRNWQGFMNGAVESGMRAASEIEQLHGIAR